MLTKLFYRYKLYRRYLPVYRKIKKYGYPVYGRGVGFMQCTTFILLTVIILFLYLMFIFA